MDRRNFLLLDLERTLETSKKHYWKQNKYGYVTNILEAGLFTCEEAYKICIEDISNNTLMLPVNLELEAKIWEVLQLIKNIKNAEGFIKTFQDEDFSVEHSKDRIEKLKSVLKRKFGIEY